MSVTITPRFGGCGYVLLSLRSVGKSITVTETGGSGCGGTQPYPVPGIWAQTQSAHTSATATLSGQENVPSPTPFDYETFSRWSLAPR